MVVFNCAATVGALIFGAIMALMAGGEHSIVLAIGASLICAAIVAAIAFTFNLMCCTIMVTGKLARNYAVTISALPVLAAFYGSLSVALNPSFAHQLGQL
jgi:hypothetical protein